MVFRKGSPRHILAGRVFVASMLTMAVAAVYLAIVRHQPSNIGGGILTFYLIGTAWLTARRRDGQTNRLDHDSFFPQIRKCFKRGRSVALVVIVGVSDELSNAFIAHERAE